MKTSIVLIVALVLNTSLLVAEPLSAFVKGINPYILIGIEVFLVLGYLLNGWFKKLSEACKMDFGYLKVFVLSGTSK